jgi:hypothetical protein
MSSENNMKALLKSSEELVTQARLRKIAKDHMSIGSLLDTRTVFALDDGYKRLRMNGRFDSEKRSVRTLNEIDAISEKKEAIADKGKELTSLGSDYTNEKEIWRAKASQPTYSLKRKFHKPEIHEYKEKMNPLQIKEYRKRIDEAIQNLADKCRAECAQLKMEMDLNGVFHPDANAHRVHCIYLMKIYKGIQSDSIEDPILEEMRNVDILKSKQEQELQEQRDNILKILESSNPTSLSKAPSSLQQMKLDLNGVSDKTQVPLSSRSNVPQSARSVTTSAASINGKAVPKTSSSISAGAAATGLEVKKRVLLSSNDEGAAPAGGITNIHTIAEESEDNESSKLPAGPASIVVALAPVDKTKDQKNADRLLVKIKRGKLANIDSKLVGNNRCQYFFECFWY